MRRVPLTSPIRSAFTMIETLIVIVIIALVAAVVVPRAFRATDRDAELAVNSLAELISTAARRDAFASQPLALTYDVDRSRVELWGRTVDAVTGKATWKADPLTPAADAFHIQMAEISSDGVALDPDRWWYEFPQSTRRPSLVVRAVSPLTGRAWTIELPATGMRAVVSEATGARPRDEVGVIDLDASGKADAPW